MAMKNLLVWMIASIISSSLGDGHRPGMLSRGQER